MIRVHSAVFERGIAVPVVLEFTASPYGLPGIAFLGTPRPSLLESRERVLASLRFLGLSLPRRKVTINMLPVDVPKVGSSLDLAIAIGLLMLSQQIPQENDCAAVGELGLNGEIRHVNEMAQLLEVLPSHLQSLYVPQEKAMELGVSRHWRFLLGVGSVGDFLPEKQNKGSLRVFQREPARFWEKHFEKPVLEGTVGEKLGQMLALSLVGGHHLLLYGSPGIGKSHVRSFLPGLLPSLEKEGMRTQWLRSGNAQRVISPHTSATVAGILGGGTPFTHGALQRANNGILFLDEMPEFRRETLESLRQPLEEENITLVRSGKSYTLGCSCTVIATANPCPCGFFGEQRCECSLNQVLRYTQRLSGPLLERFALQHRLLPERHQRSLSALSQNIEEARCFQQKRFSYQVKASLARSYDTLDLQKLGAWPVPKSDGLSIRKQLQWARLACTFADLRIAQEILPQDWSQARPLISQGWNQSVSP